MTRWTIILNGKSATQYDKGDTAIQACRLFRKEYLTWHSGKAAMEKRKSDDVAELHVDGARIRAERRVGVAI